MLASRSVSLSCKFTDSLSTSSQKRNHLEHSKTVYRIKNILIVYTLKQMRKNTEFCLEVDLQQHIRSTQQYTKPSKMYLYGTYLFVCVGGQICAAMVVRRCAVCRGLAGHRQAVLTCKQPLGCDWRMWDMEGEMALRMSVGIENDCWDWQQSRIKPLWAMWIHLVTPCWFIVCVDVGCGLKSCRSKDGKSRIAIVEETMSRPQVEPV